MGEIKRQGAINSILLYFGLGFSLLNGVILFPRIVGAEVFGFTQWVSSIAMIFNLIGGLGLQNIALRYFPYFKNKSTAHEGFLSFLLLFASLGITLSIFIILLSKKYILNSFAESNSFHLAQQFYFLLIPIIAFKIFATILQAYSRALFKAIIPVLLNELPKLLNTLLLIAVFLTLINSRQFIILYVFKLSLIVFGLLFYLYYLKELTFKSPFTIIHKNIFKEIKSFSFFSILSGAGNILISRIDILMISTMLGFGSTGVYAIFFYISNVIALPLKGLASIITPVIARAWKENDTQKINNLYQKSALILTVCGTLIFVCILINLDNVIYLLKKDIYKEGKNIAFWLGLAQVFAISAGYNVYILVHSKLYKFDLYFKLLTGLLTIVTNYFMIQYFGLVGAAMATAFTILVINCLISGFLYLKFQMQPFTWGTLQALSIGAVVFICNYFIPTQSHFLVDLILRSTILSILYISIILYLNVSPEVTGFSKEIAQKALKLVKRK